MFNKNNKDGKNRVQKKPGDYIHEHNIQEFDYKDLVLITPFISSYIKIKSRAKSGLSVSEQAKLVKAVKYARHLALIPFTDKYPRNW